MKVPLSQEVTDTLSRIRGSVAVPMLDQASQEGLRPMFLLRLAQVGDEDGNFVPSAEFKVDYQIGSFYCDQGAILYLVLWVGKQARQVFARFDLNRPQAIEWLNLLCCVDSLMIGVVDQTLEGLLVFQLQWPEASRLDIHYRIKDGLRYLRNIPDHLLDEGKVAQAFRQYEEAHVKQ